MTFKPLLADNVDLAKLIYPVFASPKLDGVRATFVNTYLVSRNLKLFGNKELQTWRNPNMIDGELIVGDPRSKSVFRDTMKVVSAHEADLTDLKYYTFDLVDTNRGFQDRLRAMNHAIDGLEKFVSVPHYPVHNEEGLIRLEEQLVSEGYEGLMIRKMDGKYKFGRSTVNEGILLKMKRFEQSEARIVDVVEQMHNANEATINNLGYTERSSHQANKIPVGVMGALTVRDIKTNVVFSVGTGFSFAERKEIWDNKEKYIGKLLTYEYLAVGVKDKPRHPAFIGFRMESDL